MLLLACLSTAGAEEVYTLATPKAAIEEPVDGWRLFELRLRREPPQVHIRLNGYKADGTCAKSWIGECRNVIVRYEGADAVNLLNLLNTRDFSTNSLSKQIMQKLAADGFVGGGVVEGAPGIPTMTPTVAPTETPT